MRRLGLRRAGEEAGPAPPRAWSVLGELVRSSRVDFALLLLSGRLNGVEVEECDLNVRLCCLERKPYSSGVFLEKGRQIDCAFDKIANPGFYSDAGQRRREGCPDMIPWGHGKGGDFVGRPAHVVEGDLGRELHSGLPVNSP